MTDSRLLGMEDTLTLYEINAAVRALAATYIIHPRSEQENAADRAYYKLLAMADAARSATKATGGSNG